MGTRAALPGPGAGRRGWALRWGRRVFPGLVCCSLSPGAVAVRVAPCPRGSVGLVRPCGTTKRSRLRPAAGLGAPLLLIALTKRVCGGEKKVFLREKSVTFRLEAGAATASASRRGRLRA